MGLLTGEASPIPGCSHWWWRIRAYTDGQVFTLAAGIATSNEEAHIVVDVVQELINQHLSQLLDLAGRTHPGGGPGNS